MQLASPAFAEGGTIPLRYSAVAGNELPPLEISGVPGAARSLVILLEDLDSPLGTVTHWLAWNLPPDTRRLDAARLPGQCCVGMDTFGKVGYLGPVPPEGRHRYRFSLLALDTELDLPAGSTRSAVEQAMTGHIVDRAELTGVVARSDSDPGSP